MTNQKRFFLKFVITRALNMRCFLALLTNTQNLVTIQLFK